MLLAAEKMKCKELPKAPSRLAQWPCQIKQVPTHAPYFAGADLLLTAACAAFACGSFHQDFMRGHITLVGCPASEGEEIEKLAAILKENEIRSLKVVRMEVPCCSGLELAAEQALQQSGKQIPLQLITLSTDGKILD